MSKEVTEAKNKEIEAVNGNVNTAIASLMDVCNYLRDIPKLIAANQALVNEVVSLREKLSKYEPVEAKADETQAAAA
jgi:hypothetical protein